MSGGPPPAKRAKNEEKKPENEVEVEVIGMDGSTSTIHVTDGTTVPALRAKIAVATGESEQRLLLQTEHREKPLPDSDTFATAGRPSRIYIHLKAVIINIADSLRPGSTITNEDITKWCEDPTNQQHALVEIPAEIYGWSSRRSVAGLAAECAVRRRRRRTS